MKGMAQEEKVTHYCPACGAWMDLGIFSTGIETDGISLEIVDSHLLQCGECGTVALPDHCRRVAAHNLEKARADGRKVCRFQVKGVESFRFHFCQDPEFIFDPADYFFIPGLADPSGSGAMTPVFFNPSVLNRYCSHPDYVLELLSRSHGTIGRGGEFEIPFGINRKGKVFMWISDIDRLPQTEQYYLRSENVPSDHDVKSNLYHAYAGEELESASLESKFLAARARLNGLCLKHRGFRLYRLAGKMEDAVFCLTQPIQWDGPNRGKKANVFDILINQSLSENHLRRELSGCLQGGEEKIKSPVLLLEKWLELVIGDGDAAATAKPFHTINDLRDQAMDLLPADERKEAASSIVRELGLGENAPFGLMFETAVKKVIESYDAIGDGLKIF
jgi:hypothetical protein